jgi:lipopolysaccharide export system permease protein
MSILARYLIRATLSYTFLVLSILLVLSGVYIFIEQQDDIGVGSYGVGRALVYVACTLPQYAFDLLPMAALIGALLGLGNLARSSELVVMRASGASVFRMAGWVALGGLLLTAFTWVIGDYLAPPLQQYARAQKTFAKFNQFNLTSNASAWAKDENTFIAVGQQSADNQFGGIYVIQFDDRHRLVRVGHALGARVGENNRWMLNDYVESRRDGEHIATSSQSKTVLTTHLAPEFLGLAVVEPTQLTGRELYGYIRHLRDNNLDAREYETAFWARIARTTALLVVILLAVPFSFGPMRSTGGGARAVIGILIGAGFFLLARLLENGGVVFDMSPLFVAWTPTAVMALITGIALARVR